MTLRDSLNRKIVASGHFNASADVSIQVPDASIATKFSSRPSVMSSLNDPTSPTHATKPSIDESLLQTLKDAVESLSTLHEPAIIDWNGLRALSDLGAFPDRMANSSSSSKTGGYSPCSDLLGAPTRGSSLLFSGETFNHQFDPSTSSDDLDSETVQAFLQSIESSSEGIRSINPSRIRSTPPYVNGSQESALGSSNTMTHLSPNLDKTDRSTGALSFTSIPADSGFISPQDLGAASWQQCFGAQNSAPVGQSPLPCGDLSATMETSHDASGSNRLGMSAAMSIERVHLPDCSFKGVDSSLNSMFANHFNPSTFGDTLRINDGELNGIQNKSYSDAYNFQSDFNSSSTNRLSQGGEIGVDLSKTNDLLQQLIEEVRKGRQGFLPIADRNSAY